MRKSAGMITMINRSTLDNWNNGNISDLSREELIQLVRFYEVRFIGSEPEINEDLED
jgi:hypothetical protein